MEGKTLASRELVGKVCCCHLRATGTPSSAAALEVQELFFKNKAASSKMPAKRKHLDFVDQPLFIKAAPYSPQFEDEEKAMEFVLAKIANHKPDKLITQAKTLMETMFVEKLSSL
jgi:hypothetical protein